MSKPILRAERLIQKEILVYLKSVGIFAFKATSPAMNGIPDIIACVNGRFLGIEVKRYDGRPAYDKATGLQLRRGEQIIRSGGAFLITDNLQDVKNTIQRIKNEKI